MTDLNAETDIEALFAKAGRISTFSVPDNCVEVAPMPNGDSIAVRNHNRPQQGWLVFTRDEFGAWLAGCKHGEFDDLLT